MSDESEYVREEWVYLGMQVNSKGKRSYKWANVDNVDDIHSFDKNIATASVGHTYFVYVLHKGEGALSVRTSGTNMPAWFGKYDNKEKVKEWAIKDETARQQLSIKSMNTKASKEAVLDDIYSDIRKSARMLNTTERMALIAKLAEIIIKA